MTDNKNTLKNNRPDDFTNKTTDKPTSKTAVQPTDKSTDSIVDTTTDRNTPDSPAKERSGGALDPKPIFVANPDSKPLPDLTRGAPLHTAKTNPLRQSLLKGAFYIAIAAIAVAFVILLLYFIATADTGSLLLSILSALSVAAFAWLMAPTLKSRGYVQDGVKGLLLLTGSLLVTINCTAVATAPDSMLSISYTTFIGLAVASLLHIAYYRITKINLVYLLSLLIVAASFGALIYNLALDLPFPVPRDTLTIAILLSIGLLVWITNISARAGESTKHLAHTYDLPAIIGSLAVMHLATITMHHSLLWHATLAVSTLALFYFGITKKRRSLTLIASLSLLATIATIVFRYISNN